TAFQWSSLASMGYGHVPQSLVFKRGPERRLSEGIESRGMITDEASPLTWELDQPGRENDLMRMLASLVTASHEFIGVADLEGNALFVNDAGCKLVGLRDLQAVRSTKIVDYFAAEDQTRILQEVLPAVRQTGFWEGELRFRNFATGALVPVQYNIFPIRDASGVITAYGTVTRNLTETKQKELQLSSLASIVESSDDAIVSKNLDGIIMSWNRGAERIFGYTATEAVGQSITILIPEDRQSEEVEILNRIRRGERIDHFETIRQRKHGSLVVVSLTVSPVKNAEGKIVGASKIARDVTEQKRNQEQITTLAREAEHRSKNLLASVQAIVNLSRADTLDGLKVAIEGRIRALANVHSLFVATRWVGAELSAIATQELAPYFAGDRKRVRIDGAATLLEPPAAQAVAVTLHELATNAAKYGALSNAGGHIALTWRHGDNGQLTLRWVETGGPPVGKPTRKGFGSRVIEQMIRQLPGQAQFDWRPDGLVCDISFRA
ncbi:MAG TPA: PAS domain S-box protein, partial [Pseudolabrys sp.]|nr:PAS domain S-box protein [Pseudolabrys sp.]